MCMALSKRLWERFGGHERVLGVKIHAIKHEYDLDMNMITDLLERERSEIVRRATQGMRSIAAEIRARPSGRHR